ncbi:MAG: T9SS type A sorting domain-containing protein [Candidatus Kapaibacteriales bacterium]
MKKSQVILFAVGLIFFFASGFSAFAQRGKQGVPNPPRFYQNCQFFDNNTDGICDNFIDANGDGRCDNCQGRGVCDGSGPKSGKGKGMNRKVNQGRNFVDSDGDGICDYYQNRIYIGMPYPNPFSTSTKFDLNVQKKRSFAIGLYDQAGNLVQKIFDGELNPGTHSFSIEANNLKTGRYFIVAKSGDFTRSRPVVFKP